MKLGVQKHSNRCRVSGGDNFLRRNDIDIPTAGDFFSRRLTAAMFAGLFFLFMIRNICTQDLLFYMFIYCIYIDDGNLLPKR